MRVAVLGGSAVSTPQLASAFADAGVLNVHLALVGRSAEKLRLVAAAARRAGDGTVEVSEHVELESAVDGADVVLSQVRVGGLEGRAFDESFARDLGIPGEETVGPGGFASSWRTLPVVRVLFERCRAAAPDALVLNLTNPASMVHLVATRVGVRIVTLCDAPIVLARKLASLVGAEPRDAAPRYAGLNHCGWITGLEFAGGDRLRQALERVEEVAALTGVDAAVIRWSGAVPNPYLRYLYHPDRQLAAQLAKRRVRAEELQELEALALEDYADPNADAGAAAARRPAPWYAECVVPLVRSLRGERVRTIVNVTNDSLLPFLPADATVEVAAEVAGGEATPLPPDPLAPDARAILEAVAAFDVLAVEAVLGGDRAGCVRALAAHPLVPSVAVARELCARVERRFGRLGEAQP